MNRKIFYLFIVFFLGAYISSHAQMVKGVLIGGMNLSQVDGDMVYGFKRVGANVGAGVIVPLGNRWSFTMETIFSMEGAKQGARGYQDSVEVTYNPFDTSKYVTLTGAYDLHLNYVRIPLLVHFGERQIAFGAGFEYGRLVGVKEIQHNRYNTTSFAEDAYIKNDLSIIGDIKIRMYKGLFFNIRYTYSLIPIREREFFITMAPGESFERKQYNNVLTFRVMWIINEGKSSVKRSSELNSY